MKMHGNQVTQRYLERHGFRYPIAVTEKEGLGLRLPSSDFSVKDVERYVGKRRKRPVGGGGARGECV